MHITTIPTEHTHTSKLERISFIEKINISTYVQRKLVKILVNAVLIHTSQNLDLAYKTHYHGTLKARPIVGHFSLGANPYKLKTRVQAKT